jgi:hypothetical protein
MNTNYKSWKMLFLFCLGLFLGSAFCMKWMEKDLVQGNQLFTILGLEITYTQERVYSLLSGLDHSVKTILQYHLYFDFVFMAGVFPGIAALCMMARFKSTHKNYRKVLLAAAVSQIVAWICDIIENTLLLSWVSDPEKIRMFDEFHLIVWVKWILAILGVILSIPVVFKTKTR